MDIAPGRAHINVMKKQVHYLFMAQSVTKVPRPDKINFKTLWMMWEWKSNHITSMVQQIIQLGYHLEKWKKCVRSC